MWVEFQYRNGSRRAVNLDKAHGIECTPGELKIAFRCVDGSIEKFFFSTEESYSRAYSIIFNDVIDCHTGVDFDGAACMVSKRTCEHDLRVVKNGEEPAFLRCTKCGESLGPIQFST